MAANPNLKWMDTSQRGYFTLDIRPDRIDTEFVFVPAIGGRSAVETGRKHLSVAYNARKLTA
jgi:alkaline phosphatase D